MESENSWRFLDEEIQRPERERRERDDEEDEEEDNEEDEAPLDEAQNPRPERRAGHARLGKKRKFPGGYCLCAGATSRQVQIGMHQEVPRRGTTYHSKFLWDARE
ncbi:hypothetical protein RJZ56_000722 [Blastomyces dermatitidis]|uniref:Uncharacterized protein n=3 Tax=Blastomyces TaxID=229219 RepID=A0A179UWK8_BLAGS|nr:uncharacterized protein BDBG_06971 [Blastomyces gilchristii SLH14081]XP_045278457.1 uncharacterized protein BDCG_07162 [Blastomyces dermatitidis ER-3]EEQ92042.1 hypothetical protein BDCG_07162 [Blastomyces dermatitidis ER-3]EGE78692.1 hypothetical protein BDDG_01629 [Blastomyces dermatitidis ATCC 18188]OAT11498.1 hypothetical protein BDBG_06971 [Blastomyces gilchristii SLH14081]